MLTELCVGENCYRPIAPDNCENPVLFAIAEKRWFLWCIQDGRNTRWKWCSQSGVVNQGFSKKKQALSQFDSRDLEYVEEQWDGLIAKLF